MLDGPVVMHEDEVLKDAQARIKNGDWPREYNGHYVECPGCALLTYRHDTDDHATRCQALRDLVCWEATGEVERDPQPARLGGGAH